QPYGVARARGLHSAVVRHSSSVGVREGAPLGLVEAVGPSAREGLDRWGGAAAAAPGSAGGVRSWPHRPRATSRRTELLARRRPSFGWFGWDVGRSPVAIGRTSPSALGCVGAAG